MPRPRAKDSTSSFLNLGLDQHEEEQFKTFLKRKDISARNLLRVLIRDWIREQRNYYKNHPQS